MHSEHYQTQTSSYRGQGVSQQTLTNRTPVFAGSGVIEAILTELAIQDGRGVVTLPGPYLGSAPAAVCALAPGTPLTYSTRSYKQRKENG